MMTCVQASLGLFPVHPLQDDSWMRLYYTDHFELPLPEGHRFPMSKYRLLRERLASSEHHRHDVFIVPPPATDDQLLLCHTPRYLEAVKTGTLSPTEIRRIGFPWSEKMVERSRRSTGATIAACRAALEDSVSVNLAGGTHHAMADAGEGYCVFNDAAVALRVLQRERLIERGCVIDLDVHQGNGTASIFANDPTVVTLSMHGEKNFPSRKSPSDIDVPLVDGTGDAEYLAQLAEALVALEQRHRENPFDVAIFLAGADPYSGDRLGRMALTQAGIADRDQNVLEWARKNGVPLAIAMAGGYAQNVADIVEIHARTIGLATHFCRQRGAIRANKGVH